MNDMYELSRLYAVPLVGAMFAAVYMDVRHDLCRLVSGRNVVLFSIWAWYLLEALMLPAALREYTQAQYDTGIFHVGLAITGFLVGYHYTSGCSLFPKFGEKITFFDDERWLWKGVLIGAMIGFAPVVYFTGTQFDQLLEDMLGMRTTWGGLLSRGRYGGVRAAFLELQMFIRGVSPFAAIVLVSRRSSLIQRLFSGFILTWCLLGGWGSGTRSALLSAIAPLLAVVYWKATTVQRKVLICGALACIPIVYGLMAAIVMSRGSGTFSWESGERAHYVGNEMFRELLFITSKVPSEVGYKFGYVYLVQLVNPIPRFLWPDKPSLDAGLLMADMYGAVDARGVAYMTVSPGLIGEMYLNFGVFGIFGLSVFGGWLVKGWDLIPKFFAYSLPALMYYSIGLGVLILMGRSFTMHMFYGLISLALLAWLIRYFNPNAVVEADSAARIGYPRG